MSKPQGLSSEGKYEVAAEAYYTALQALEDAFRDASSRGHSKSEIADRASMSRSSVSRILNGDAKNITLKTLFLMMFGMGRRTFIWSLDKSDLSNKRGNFFFSPSGDDLSPKKLKTLKYNTIKAIC